MAGVIVHAATGRPQFAALPPLGLYVHIPWCVRKCPYCDFNSHEARGALPEREYADALLADLEAALPLIWNRPFYTVFFGGGTPSLLAPETVEYLLAGIRARIPLQADAEVTLEANPGTLEAGRFAAFRQAGATRLSVGIQSFNPAHLKALGRIHDDGQAQAAATEAAAHFDTYNLDLMYGLPDQAVAEARADIQAALAYAPPHLSVYHLTLEPNTLFHRHPPQLPDDDVTAAMQEAAEALLAAAGYEHYETSAFARPGHRCRHNVNYWQFGDYLGIGAGAHSKISFPDRIVRQMRYRQPQQYLNQVAQHAAVMEEHEVTGADIGFEFMMNALRLTGGFPAALFSERTGTPLHSVLRPLDAAEQRGLIRRDHERIVPTAQGQRFLNDLLALFLPER